MCLAARQDFAVGETKVTIFIVDADVAILGCYFAKIPIHIYLQICVGSKHRELDI